MHKFLSLNNLRVLSLIKVDSLLARTYVGERRILGQAPSDAKGVPPGRPRTRPAQPGTHLRRRRLVRFRYRRFRETNDPPGAPARVKLSIPARVIGLSSAACLFGLLDTGSELTLLDKSFIDVLDVHIRPGNMMNAMAPLENGLTSAMVSSTWSWQTPGEQQFTDGAPG